MSEMDLDTAVIGASRINNGRELRKLGVDVVLSFSPVEACLPILHQFFDLCKASLAFIGYLADSSLHTWVDRRSIGPRCLCG